MIGPAPVLRRELLTLLRSRRAFVLLWGFAMLTAVTVVLRWPEAGTVGGATGRVLFGVFYQVQLAAVCLAAPALSSTALTGEKEQGTWDFVRLLPLSPAQVVVEKMLSSSVLLMLLLTAGLPATGALFLLGGVGGVEVVSVYMALAAALVAFAAAGIAFSAFFTRSFAAVAGAYLVTLPVAALLALRDPTGRTFNLATGSTALFVGILSAIVLLAVAAVRSAARDDQPEETLAEQEDPWEAASTTLVLDPEQFPDNMLVPRRTAGLLPDGVNPVRYKEQLCEILGRGTRTLRFVILGSMVLSVPLMLYSFLGADEVYVLYLLAFVLLVGPPFVSGMFTGERERGTWDMLNTTLLRPRDIVIGKLTAALRIIGSLTAFLCVPLVLTVLLTSANASSDDMPALLRGLLYVAVTAMAITSLSLVGLAVSRRSDATLAALLRTYVVVAGVWLLPVVLHAAATNLGVSPHVTVWPTALSPFAAVLDVGDPWTTGNREIELREWLDMGIFRLYAVHLVAWSVINIVIAKWLTEDLVAERAR